jgi:hypothetical protein
MAELTEDERRILWEQFVETYTDSQETFDASTRTLAAAGVAVAVTLGTALKDFGWWGIGAVLLFLVSLGANLVSYATAQKDMSTRLVYLQADEGEEVDGDEWGNRWTKRTTWLNVAAGVTLLLGGVLLAGFVWTAT